MVIGVDLEKIREEVKTEVEYFKSRLDELIGELRKINYNLERIIYALNRLAER